MTNSAIADNFSLLSKLMDIHQENSFKAKSYSIAAFNIEKLEQELTTIPQKEIFSIKGIGESVAQKIVEQIETQQLQVLIDYINKTPEGIIAMLEHIKGLGPKKIATIWREMNIESVGELLYACNENRLTLYKGFGEKTQESVRKNIEFYLSNLGSYLYPQVENYAAAFENHLKQYFKNDTTFLTGDFIKQLPVIDKVEFCTTVSKENLIQFFLANNYVQFDETIDTIQFKGVENILLQFYISSKNEIVKNNFEKTCSPEFLQHFNLNYNLNDEFKNDEDIFIKNNLSFIPKYKRENYKIIDAAKSNSIPKTIEVKDITSIIHCHSKWSDGSNTLEEMVVAAKAKGLQYLVISDHSKTASYAQGLSIESVIKQHEEIETLNKKYAPFKIFKSIESDILGDGSLDYEDDILKTFDCVIASVHSNLNMTEEKAMQRLLTAIENPYTTILGHMTGRLLLSRKGYPLNYSKIIDACAANQVVIELNAHPRRLDIDWSLIDEALEKDVLISINPDAHNLVGFDDIKYGVLVAQKTMLTKEQNLSSFSLNEFEKYISS